MTEGREATDGRGEHPRQAGTEVLAPADQRGTSRACGDCLRRSWLLATLSARLSYHARDRGRLLRLLALGDKDLIEAIGGRRRWELQARYARFESRDIHWSTGVQAICHHHRDYPRGLAHAGERAPRMLYMAGAAQLVGELNARSTVAIVGTSRATDYGMEMTRSLARGLTASGLTVAAGLSDGIAVAAQEGALEAKGKTLAVMDCGLDGALPARRRALYARLQRTGCVVAELPCGRNSRNWCETARERTLVGLARLTILVEADVDPGELLSARVAKALGRTVAAVPGRVTSPVSRGTHALLMAGAPMVRGPEDVLDLLYKGNLSREMIETPRRRSGPPRVDELESKQRETLEQVGAGRDTPAKLIAASADTGDTLLALSELELMGLLTRGDGGRYVPRESLAGR